MTRKRRFISRTASLAAIAAALTLAIGGCFFDADLPLQNDPPESINRSSITASLIFPNSSVCTLAVDDLNDSALAVWTLPCPKSSVDTPLCDSSQRLSWPGKAVFIERGLGTKKLHLMLDTSRMGRYKGVLLLQDAASATLKIPYAVDKLFFDPFDAFPPAKEWWSPYDGDYSSYVKHDYADNRLVFSFVKSDDTGAASVSTGLRTRFSLQDELFVTVDFKLRDEMDGVFEAGFFISSRPDTGRWAGERAGIFISGINGRLRFECRSVNMQSYSFESGASAGELGIRRADSTISYLFYDGNPAIAPKPLTSQTFPAGLPVFVHMKMSVGDLSRTRNCYWNNFRVLEGLLQFPEK